MAQTTRRARFKDLADIDPALICCDERRERIASLAGREYDVIPTQTLVERTFCWYCDEVVEDRGVALAQLSKDGCDYIGIAFIDIDEGNPENGESE